MPKAGQKPAQNRARWPPSADLSRFFGVRSVIFANHPALREESRRPGRPPRLGTAGAGRAFCGRAEGGRGLGACAAWGRMRFEEGPHAGRGRSGRQSGVAVARPVCLVPVHAGRALRAAPAGRGEIRRRIEFDANRCGDMGRGWFWTGKLVAPGKFWCLTPIGIMQFLRETLDAREGCGLDGRPGCDSSARSSAEISQAPPTSQSAKN